ncbi:hypothetical protein P9112_003649 [Eukaryota sp. TZLM1-RC]
MASVHSPRTIHRQLTEKLSGPRKPLSAHSPLLESKVPQNEHSSLVPEWAAPLTFADIPSFLSEPLPAIPDVPLSKIPLPSQESLLSKALLSALLGHHNPFISFDPSPSPSLHVKCSLTPSCLSADSSLTSLLSYSLPLVSSVLFLRRFTSSRSAYGFNSIIHATAAALNAYLNDFDLMIAQLDDVIGNVTLSKMIANFSSHKVVLVKLSQAFSDLSTVDNDVFFDRLLQKSFEFKGDESWSVFESIVASAMVPFCTILKKFLCFGQLEDPFDEFFIVKERQGNYALKTERVPNFLQTVANQILDCGNYVMIAYQSRYLDPFSDIFDPNFDLDKRSPLLFRLDPTNPPRPNLRAFSGIISDSLKWTSKMATLSIFDCGLIEFLTDTVHHYFLLGSGEWVLNFLELSINDLMSPCESIDPERLSLLLEIIGNHKQNAKNIPKVEMLQYSITGHLTAINSLQASNVGDISVGQFVKTSVDQRRKLTALQAMTIKVDVEFPLNIVFDVLVMQKLSLLFRHFLNLRYSERLIMNLWTYDSMFRSPQFRKKTEENEEEFIAKSDFFRGVLKYRQQMLHFIQSLSQYCSVSTIEPAWRTVLNELNTCQSPKEIQIVVKNFVDGVLRKCLLTSRDVFKSISFAVEKVDVFCRFVDRMYSTGHELMDYDYAVNNLKLIGSDFDLALKNLIGNLEELNQREFSLGVDALLTLLNYSEFYFI